jgi:hypothetical protein
MRLYYIILFVLIFAIQSDAKQNTIDKKSFTEKVKRNSLHEMIIYTPKEFLNTLAASKVKDDFETDTEYELRLTKEFGSSDILLSYTDESIMWVRYDLNNLEFDIELSTHGIQEIDMRGNQDSIYFDYALRKRLSPYRGRYDDEISIKIPYDLNTAKSLKDLKNYGFEFYVKIHLSNSIKNSFKSYNFDLGRARNSSTDATSIIIHNKSIKYEKEF